MAVPALGQALTSRQELTGTTYDSCAGGGRPVICYYSPTDQTYTYSSANLLSQNGTNGGGLLLKAGSGQAGSGTAYRNTIGNGNATFTGNAKFQSNSATNGGAIYVEGNSSYKPTLALSSTSEFIGNTASSSGGAIYNLGTTNISGAAAFSGNTSNAQGGAIYNAGTLSIAAGTAFTNNNAGSQGGAIWSNKLITFATGAGDITFSNNTANGKANDIYLSGADSKINITGNGKVIFNGGIVADTSIRSTAIITNEANTTLSGISSFTGATNRAIYNTGTFAVSGATFNDNTHTINGAAIYNSGNLTIGSDTTFFGNQAVTTGGAIFAESDVVISGSNILFEENKTTGNTSAGGAIYVISGANLNVSGATFKNNSSSIGGAIYSDGDNDVTIGSNTSFIGNEGGYTGAVHQMYDSTLTISGSDIVFDGNKGTAADGGAGEIYTLGTTYISGATFKNNTAVKHAGAIMAAGKLTIGANTKFTNNTAGEKGGAIYMGLNNLTFDLSSSDVVTFSGNTAGGVGNDIYLEKDTTMNIKGGEVQLLSGFAGTTEAGESYAVNVTNGGILNIGISNFNAQNGDLYFDSTSTLRIHLDGSVGPGRIQANTITIDTGAEISFVINNFVAPAHYYFSLLNVDNEADLDGVFEHSVFSISNNILYDIVYDGNGQYDITTRKNVDVNEELKAAGANKNQIAVIEAMRNTAATGNANIDNFVTAFNNELQTNVGSALKVANQIMPNINQLSMSVAHGISSSTMEAVDTRLNTVRDEFEIGDDYTAPWAQSSVSSQDLKATNDVLGFKGDINSLAAGIDKKDGNFAMGIAYTNAKPDFESVGNKIMASSHNASLYAGYYGEKFYSAAIVTGGVSSYKMKGSVLGFANSAEYDVISFGGGLKVGYNGETFSPFAQVMYTHLSIDKYSDSLGQTIADSSAGLLTADFGLSMGTSFGGSYFKINPKLMFAGTYDIMPGTLDAEVALAGGGSYTLIGEDIPTFGAKAGAIVEFDLFKNINLTASYIFDFRGDYQNSVASVTGRLKF